MPNQPNAFRQEVDKLIARDYPEHEIGEIYWEKGQLFLRLVPSADQIDVQIKIEKKK